MGTTYKIRCRRCGAQFDSCAGTGALHPCTGSGGTYADSYVETEIPIRCPNCMHRLNATQEEFMRQVETVMIWDRTNAVRPQEIRFGMRHEQFRYKNVGNSPEKHYF